MPSTALSALSVGVSVASKTSLTGEAAYWASLTPKETARIKSYGVAHLGGSRDDMMRNLVSAYKQALAWNRRERAGSCDRNAQHNAQADVIMANRSLFPPGQFAIKTELDEGASVTTYIPALGAGVRTELSMGITIAALQAEIILDAPGRAHAPPAWGRDKKVEAPGLDEMAFAFSQVQGGTRG